MGKRAEQQIQIAAAPPACFDAITDFESYPDWQSAVKAVEVHSRYDDGLGHEVTTTIDARVKTISYTLRYSYEPPSWIGWDYVDGDVKEIDGEFTFEDLGDGTTLATYSLVIDTGVWLPGPVAKVLNDQVMRGSVEDLKRRVEGG